MDLFVLSYSGADVVPWLIVLYYHMYLLMTDS
jgi:hypothetical protein